MAKPSRKSGVLEILVSLEPWQAHWRPELTIDIRIKGKPDLMMESVRLDPHGRATLRVERGSPFAEALRSKDDVFVRVLDRRGRQFDIQPVIVSDDSHPVSVKLHLASSRIRNWRAVSPAFVRRLADRVGRLYGVTAEKAKAPPSVIAAIEDLNYVGRLAAQAMAGQKTAAVALREQLRSDFARKPGAEFKVSAKSAMAGLTSMSKVWASEFAGFRCDPTVGRLMEIMAAGFALDVMDGQRTARSTEQARSFVGSRMRAVQEFRRIAGRPGGVGGGGVPEVPEGDDWEPILPDDIPQDIPEPEPPAGAGDICEQVGDLCAAVYEDAANAALREEDPNRTLLGVIEPNCLKYNYDPDTVFSALPAANRSFAVPQPPEFRLYFRNQNITGSIESYAADRIRFKLPAQLYNLSGLVSLADLSVLPASRRAIDPDVFVQMCGISLPDVPSAPPAAISSDSYISVIFPPVFDTVTVTGIEGEWPEKSCAAPMKLCWRSNLADQPASSRVIACGSIEVDIVDGAGKKVISAGEQFGCVRIIASKKEIYTAEARSYANGELVGRATQRIVVKPTHHVRIVREQPAQAEAEVRAGEDGRFRIEVSCPPEQALDIDLSVNHPDVLRVPARVTLPAGANKLSVDFTTRTGRPCWPIKVTAAPIGDYFFACIDYVVFQVPNIDWRYLSPIVRAFWGFSVPVTSGCLPEDATRIRWRFVADDGLAPAELPVVVTPRLGEPFNQYQVVLRDEDAVNLRLGTWRLRAEVPDRGVVSNWISLSVGSCLLEVVMSTIRVASGQNESLDLTVTATADGHTRKWPLGQEFREVGTGQRVDVGFLFKRYELAAGTTRPIDISARVVDLDDFLRFGDDFGEASGQLTLTCEGSSTTLQVSLLADTISCSESEDPLSGETTQSCSSAKTMEGVVDVTFVGRPVGAAGAI